jgi:TolA-binding protein
MRLPRVKALLIAALPLLPGAAVLALPLPAMGQISSREGIALRDQILQLRHEVDALRAQVANSGGSFLGGAQRQSAPPSSGTSDMVVQLLDRMNTVDDEVRNLRGQLDELQNGQGQKLADLDKKLDDLKFEVEHPGAAAAAAGAASAPPPGRPAPHAAAPAPSREPAREAASAPSNPSARAPAGPLQEAYAALDRHDYAAAERSARGVLARRAAPGAYDAQFVLAEALAGQHQWSRAAIAYDDAYNRSKHGTHAPAALLGLAQSLAAINEHRAACETLAKLHAQYPREGAALRTQAAAVSRNAGCR